VKIGKHLIKGIRFEESMVIFVLEGNGTCSMTPPTKAIKLTSQDDPEHVFVYQSGVINAYVHHQTYNSIANYAAESGTCGAEGPS